MPNSPLTNTRIPDTTYATDPPQDIRNAIYDIEASTCPRFTSQASRDTAYNNWIAAGNTLADGRHCFTDDAGYWTRENGTWRSFTGLIGHGIATTGGTYTSGTATRLTSGLPMGAYLKAGRAYEYSCQLRVWSTVAADIGSVTARLTLGNGAVAVTDPVIGSATAVLGQPSSADLYNLTIVKSFQVTTTGSYQFNLWGNRPLGTGTLTFTTMADGYMYQQVVDNGVALSTLPVPVPA